MKKTILLFIDALKPEYLKDMPFLASFGKKCGVCRLHTVLGYSHAAHASIWTGCYPEKHGLFLSYYLKKFKHKKSYTFEWTKPVQTFSLSLPRLLGEYAIRKSMQPFGWGKGFRPGIQPQLLSKLAYEEVAEDKSFQFARMPTLFSILDDNHISYKYFREDTDSTRCWRKENINQEISIFFTALIDYYAQSYGLGTRGLQKILQEVDQKAQSLLSDLDPNKYDIFIFSDHGMVQTKQVFDLNHEFKKKGLKNGSQFFAFYDSTFCRVWCQKHLQNKIISFFKRNIPSTYLDRNMLRKFHVPRDNNKYGDLIFLTHPGIVLASNKIQSILKVRMKAMHGFTPDYKEMDGILLSNCVTTSHAKIIDILPSILQKYNIKNLGMDGKSILNLHRKM